MSTSGSIDDAIAQGYGWRPVAGYEGIYEVSWWGCVRRIAGGIGTSAGKKPRCLKASTSGGKSQMYKQVQLSWKGKRHTFLVHILVAKAWLGAAPEDEYGTFEVHHKDNDVSNNCIDNLEWMSKRDNMAEAWHRYITKGNPSG